MDLPPADDNFDSFNDAQPVLNGPVQVDEPSQSLEEDPRLLELAKQAAQCKHEVQGVPYDRSRAVDIGDIKFIVIELVLPLGSK